MREWDLLDSLIAEAIELFRAGNHTEGFLKMTEAKGACQVYLSQETVWELAREDYERGLTPKRIALKHGLIARSVTTRAYDQGWLNPRKIEKALQKEAKISRKHNSFKLDCVICKNKFQSASGNNHTCDICRALNMPDIGLRTENF